MSTLDRSILERFQIPGELVEILELKRGHINETFVSKWRDGTSEKRYIHQRINHEVFKDLPLLMRNIHTVTKHLAQKFARGEGQPGEVTLTLVPARFGALYLEDSTGNYWRTYHFIENTRCLEVCTDPEQAYRASQAFGRFARYLSDLDPKALGETIPRFQDSLFRFEQLDEALKNKESKRSSMASPEINFALQHRLMANIFAEAKKSGEVPDRPTHSDPKLNNVLLDIKSGAGVCIVDLDTCMPGTALYDFGDLARNTSIPAAEDEQDFSKVLVKPELFEAVSRGYLEEFGKFLTKGEVKLLPQAACLLALTLGVRFLTDFLNGDTYFRVHRENQNLERARTQFEIVRGMIKSTDTLERIIIKCMR